MQTSSHHRRLAWAMLVVVPAALHAQPIYRCGNTYSQTPCADGIVVSAEDSRTAAQKAQTDAATAQATRRAAQMQRERLTAERSPGSSASQPGPIKAQPAPRSTATSARQTGPKPKASEPGYFTAAARTAEKTKATTAPVRD